jgi:hypothetical protein
MRGNRLRVFAAAGAAIAIAGFGCGSSSTLTRAEFVKRGNAICRERRAKVAAIQDRDKGNLVAIITDALPVANKSMQDLDALKPPKAMQARYKEFLAGERRQIDRVKGVLVATKAHRRPGRPLSVTEIHRHARITRALGLSDCN